MEASVYPYPRGPVWMPITPKTGSLFHADSHTRFLDAGPVCLSNNAAERALRGVAIGRRNWTFAGSDAGGHRAAAVYTLIETCKMNDVDPQAWLADEIGRA